VVMVIMAMVVVRRVAERVEGAVATVFGAGVRTSARGSGQGGEDDGVRLLHGPHHHRGPERLCVCVCV
jgi:hypothetical protein